jgi:hypothetical protein
MKWTIAIIVILTLTLLTLYLVGKKSVRSEIIINANTKNVWKVLMNTEKYSEWNPTMKVIEGKLQEEEKVLYQFTQDEKNQYEISAVVHKIEPEKLLNQKGGIPFILTYNPQYIFEPQGEKTKVIITEEYQGIYVPFWNPEPVQKAYEKLNTALKNRAENN